MPRANAACSHCGLSFEEAMRRSDLPEAERPPAALYVPAESPTALRDDQKFWIGLWFCLSALTLALGNWLSGILFVIVMLGVTPAVRLRVPLADRLYQVGLTLIAMAGCLLL